MFCNQDRIRQILDEQPFLEFQYILNERCLVSEALATSMPELLGRYLLFESYAKTQVGILNQKVNAAFVIPNIEIQASLI